MDRITRNLIACLLLLVGVSASDGCMTFNCGGGRAPPPTWLRGGQQTDDPLFVNADWWIREAEFFQAKADRLDPGELERFLRRHLPGELERFLQRHLDRPRAKVQPDLATLRCRWRWRKYGGEMPWRHPPRKNADGLWTFQLLDGQWTVRNAKGHWNARLKPKPRARRGPRRWTLKNESKAPLKVTYVNGRDFKTKTLKPGETLKLTTGSDGISYTVRQGERKKKGTAKPRRGTTLRTVWG